MEEFANKVVQLVTFEVGQELFGLPVASIQEVIKFSRLTPAPGAMDILEGVIDLRGDIIPVIDLRKRLQLEMDTAKNNASKILITEIGEYIFGIIVDKVDEVLSLSSDDFLPPPPGTIQSGSEFIVGVTRVNGRLLLYLDIDQVVKIDQIIQEMT